MKKIIISLMLSATMLSGFTPDVHALKTRNAYLLSAGAGCLTFASLYTLYRAGKFKWLDKELSKVSEKKRKRLYALLALASSVGLSGLTYIVLYPETPAYATGNITKMHDQFEQRLDRCEGIFPLLGEIQEAEENDRYNKISEALKDWDTYCGLMERQKRLLDTDNVKIASNRVDKLFDVYDRCQDDDSTYDEKLPKLLKRNADLRKRAQVMRDTISCLQAAHEIKVETAKISKKYKDILEFARRQKDATDKNELLNEMQKIDGIRTDPVRGICVKMEALDSSISELKPLFDTLNDHEVFGKHAVQLTHEFTELTEQTSFLGALLQKFFEDDLKKANSRFKGRWFRNKNNRRWGFHHDWDYHWGRDRKRS